MANQTHRELIEAAIRAVGGRQALLAERLGCAQQTVSKLITGEIKMTAEWAARIARATGGAVPFGAFYPDLMHSTPSPSVAVSP